MAVLWVEFSACAGLIVYCGTNLTRYGDVIAEKTGLGRAWIGLILMAGVTSLPELINGLSSVALAGVPDIAVGDVMGSCVFNLAIFALVDLLNGRTPVLSMGGRGHLLSAGIGLILICISTLSILAGDLLPALGSIGLYTPAIIAIYVAGVRSMFAYEKKEIEKDAGKMARAVHYREVPTGKAVIRFIVNALFIVGAATWLPFVGDRLATATGLGQTFIGSIFVAMTTSLPELVVTIAALKIGAVDMAVADLFGSNMFDLLILAIDDIFYKKGPLLADVSVSHALTGLTAILMTGIAIVAMTFGREKKTFLRPGWAAVALFLSYLVNIYLLYSLRGAK